RATIERICAFPCLNLGEGFDDPPTLGFREPPDSLVLGLKPEAGSALLLGANPQVSDHRLHCPTPYNIPTDVGMRHHDRGEPKSLHRLRITLHWLRIIY